ncbi:MAG: DMT family transporter [Paracoccaceae bacterium]
MENLRGIILMVASMAGFAIEDMFIKLASDEVPVGQILMTLGIGGTIFFMVALRIRGERFWGRDLLSAAVSLRNLGEIIGSVGFVCALALMPISSASAILQAAPLAVTLGAALFLGEAVGWRRWSAIFIGFIGVMMIVRPGLEGFNVYSIFALVSVAGLAMRDLATRQVAKSISSLRLAAVALIVVIPTGAALSLFTAAPQMPGVSSTLYLLGAISVGAVSYYAVILATRLGEVSVIAPFRYSRLLFALGIGYFIFAERPDFWTLFGATIIIASGVYTFAREQRLRRKNLIPAARSPLGTNPHP